MRVSPTVCTCPDTTAERSLSPRLEAKNVRTLLEAREHLTPDLFLSGWYMWVIFRHAEKSISSASYETRPRGIKHASSRRRPWPRFHLQMRTQPVRGPAGSPPTLLLHPSPSSIADRCFQTAVWNLRNSSLLSRKRKLEKPRRLPALVFGRSRQVFQVARPSTFPQ